MEREHDPAVAVESESAATAAAVAAMPLLAGLGPVRLDRSGILALQRTAGNRAVGRLLQRDEDPAIKKRQDAQKRISTQLPAEATGSEFTNSYTLTRGGATVEILPDRFDGASTYTDLQWEFTTAPSFTTADAKVDSVTSPEVKVTIQTVYQAGVTGSEDSAYGRGTTPDDIKAGQKSLRFHESRHGQDYLDYLSAHPLPTLDVSVGTKAAQAQPRTNAYIAALKKWLKDALADSEKKTDSVGKAGKHTRP